MYVTGAVLRPGKLISDRPLSVIQAVIESGVDPVKSNLKAVKVIRTGADGHYMYQVLNLQASLTDRPGWANRSRSSPTTSSLCRRNLICIDPVPTCQQALKASEKLTENHEISYPIEYKSLTVGFRLKAGFSCRKSLRFWVRACHREERNANLLCS